MGAVDCKEKVEALDAMERDVQLPKTVCHLSLKQLTKLVDC